MIVLTGASGGIGRAILPSLANLDEVIAMYNTNPADINGLTGVIPYQLDITSERGVADFVESMKDQIWELITTVQRARDSL